MKLRCTALVATLRVAVLSGLLAASLVASADGPHAKPVAAENREGAFSAENKVAMERMMRAMHVRPTGDIDADFVAMMTPHHQGAIDMAAAYLRHGTNEQLRRLAQDIVTQQQREIAAMRLMIDRPSTPSPGAQ